VSVCVRVRACVRVCVCVCVCERLTAYGLGHVRVSVSHDVRHGFYDDVLAMLFTYLGLFHQLVYILD